MKRCVSGFLICALVLIGAHAAADDAAAKQEKPQPVGIFSSDDGKTILVGIGTTKPLATLDNSRGEVKIGSTGTACIGTLSGTLRYANSKLQLCDGAGWRNVSLDKEP